MTHSYRKVISLAGTLLMIGCVGAPTPVNLPTEHPADPQAQVAEFWGITSPFPIVNDPVEGDLGDREAHDHGQHSGHSEHSGDSGSRNQKEDHSEHTEHGN